MSFGGGDQQKTFKVGPWGGQDGFSWDDGVYSAVRQLVIAHGAFIDSIQIEYDMNGTSIWSEKHGGNGGNRVDKVKLAFPDEFLTAVHGHYGSLHERGPVCVRSLTFQSNKKTYGPFGVEQGTYFSLPTYGGKIVGFHGKNGWYIDAIGIYSKTIQQQQTTSKALAQYNSYVNNGTEGNGFSIMQGSTDNSYDIVVAVRKKDEYGNPLQSKPSTQLSLDFTDADKTALIQTTSFEKKPEGVATYGPWGGTGGTTFDDGTYTGIRQIHLSRNVGIVYIKVQYDRDGQAVWGSKHGGTGGFKTEKIIFDYPYEVLTHITGTYGPLMYMGPHIIKSLTFHTNKGRHGPFGEVQGPSFSTEMDHEGKIIGFHGKEGFFLDAIGVHMMKGKVKSPKDFLSDAIFQTESGFAEIENSPWSNKLVLAKRRQTEEVAFGVVKEPAPCGPGPWGGDGGRAWDDGVFTGIRQIFLTRTAEAICSIQIEYDRNGQAVWSVKHGGNGGTATHRVKLEYPHEMLICVSGYYGALNGDERSRVVKSLTFYTSRGKYGPFGEEVGTFFTSTTTEGKVVGFHGRNSAYLDAIGVHMQHWLGNNRAPKPSRFKIFC